MADRKNINVPSTYDPVAFQKLFEQMADTTQSKYLTGVDKAPEASQGKNNEIRVDNSSGKLYIKIGGTWKAFSPD